MAFPGQVSRGPAGDPRTRSRFEAALVSMLKSRLLTHRPFFLAHAVTFGCNSRCLTCSYWKLTPRMKEDLPTAEVFAMIDQAYDAGMRGYYLFGGEPLVRKDVGELVDHANRRGFVTVMNTNGSLLSTRAPSLRGLDFAFVSIDHFTPYNDVIRGRPGTFAEVIRGIGRLRQVTEAKVTLVTTISRLNLEAIEPMARFAQDLGVCISFNSVEPTLDFGLTNSDASPNFEYGLTPRQLHGFYETLLRLKRDGYPLMETEYVLRDFVEGRGWKCEFPKMFVYVSPDQKIYSCDYRYGYDLRHGSFEEYFSSPAFREHVRKAEHCNRCVRTCVRGYSYTYDFRFLHLLGLAENAIRLYRQGPRLGDSLGPGEPVPAPAIETPRARPS